jgi:hypothetical protein
MHNGVSSTRFRPIESSLAEKYLSSEEFSPERKVGNIIISNQNKLLRKLIGRCFLYLSFYYPFILPHLIIATFDRITTDRIDRLGIVIVADR